MRNSSGPGPFWTWTWTPKGVVQGPGPWTMLDRTVVQNAKGRSKYSNHRSQKLHAPTRIVWTMHGPAQTLIQITNALGFVGADTELQNQ